MFSDYYRELVELEDSAELREGFNDWYHLEIEDLLKMIAHALELHEEEHPISFERRTTDRNIWDETTATYYLYLATEGLETPDKRVTWSANEAGSRAQRTTVSDGFGDDYRAALYGFIYQAIRNEYSNQLLSRAKADTSA